MVIFLPNIKRNHIFLPQNPLLIFRKKSKKATKIKLYTTEFADGKLLIPKLWTKLNLKKVKDKDNKMV